MRFLLRVFLLLKVRGKENLPNTGACIIAPNHSSFSDPLILQSALDRRLTFMMTSDVYENSLEWLFSMMGCINVKEGMAINAMKEGLRALQSEKALTIFPEGVVTHDGNLNEGKAGVSSLARKGTPIIPVALVNANKFLKRTAKIPSWVRLRVEIGKAIVQEEGEGKVHLTWRVMQSLSEMLNEKNPNGDEPDFKK